jgi:xylan 1,4-beta-xylosidase
MPAQVEQLRAAGAMAPAEHLRLHDGKLELTVPAHGLAVVLIGK